MKKFSSASMLRVNKVLNQLDPNQSDNLWIISPLLTSEWLTSHIGGHCKAITLKLDALQNSGSFKVRGMSTFMKKQLRSNDKINTFVSTSSANAGMAVAYVAKKLRCQCLIILDETQRENELLSGLRDEYNAKIQFNGSNWNEADKYAIELCKMQNNFCYVPMFDDAAIFEGHSSIIHEIKHQYSEQYNLSHPDCIIVSCGGGGLLTGLMTGLLKVGWSQKCQIVAAQSCNCALFDAAVSNEYKPIAVKTISSEGINLGFRSVCKAAMDLAHRYNEFGNPIKSMIVEDSDVLKICSLFAKKHHVLIEPLCATALAVLYQNKEYFGQFENVCVVVCGGNHIWYKHDE